MKIDTNEKKIEELLTRSVEEILPSKKELREVLMSGKRLRIYIGTDATGTSLHLGHATNYIILEKFRKLGHEVIFLIGDFTSRIGDPTDKSDTARKQLTREDVMQNTKTWINQVKPVIDVDNTENPIRILFNHDWLAQLTFEDIINLASNFTVQQMIERDMFQKRMESGKPLYLHELFYPLMQGYDSVAMDVDIEMCGMDQKFNALAGRTLLKKLKNKEKFVFITTLLENPTTGEKMMSKSLGTGVFLDFNEVKMYGAIMAQADENMRQLFVDCTSCSFDEIQTILSAENPRDAKMQLAFKITQTYHGDKKAECAQKQFIETFQKGIAPDDVVEIKPVYIESLLTAEIIMSKTELRRLLEAGGVKDAETGEKLFEIPDHVDTPRVLKIGKRRFVKLVP
ncbi:MAG: tyrosine--tRNA ligase [Candidatus Pacebacteria bacterium]|nr:tyrosine--tRNA ligase [Candidatus Paceibacterota bacterium]MCF7857308.1 tyrosine--tRNA ligase [Candidatus Paceibacterota bacterium]